MPRHRAQDSWKSYRSPLRCLNSANVQEKIKEMFGTPSSWVIIGPPRSGKSTFLLWALHAALGAVRCRRHSGLRATKGFNILDLRGLAEPEVGGEWRPWFERVLVLSPLQYRGWEDALEEANPATTLVVADAPFRDGDPPRLFDEKALAIANLCLVRDDNPSVPELGKPFHVLLTLREDEYDRLVDRQKQLRFSTRKVVWSVDEVWSILESHLRWRRVRCDLSGPPNKNVMDLLMEKSQGAPGYCALLVAELAAAGKRLDRETLLNLPNGIVNLVFQSLCRNFPRDTVFEAVCPIIGLLAETKGPVSERLLEQLVCDQCPASADDSNEFKSSWRIFKDRYLLATEAITGKRSGTTFLKFEASWRFLKLPPTWTTALVEVVGRGFQVERRYAGSSAQVLNMWPDISKYKADTIHSISERLAQHFSVKDDFPLLLDLCRLGEQGLQVALSLFKKTNDVGRVRTNLRDQIESIFYEGLPSSANRHCP